MMLYHVAKHPDRYSFTVFINYVTQWIKWFTINYVSKFPETIKDLVDHIQEEIKTADEVDEEIVFLKKVADQAKLVLAATHSIEDIVEQLIESWYYEKDKKWINILLLSVITLLLIFKLNSLSCARLALLSASILSFSLRFL